MASENDPSGHEIDVCTPLIGENSENEKLHFPIVDESGQTMDQNQFGYNGRNQHEIPSHQNGFGHGRSGSGVYPPQDYPSEQELGFNFIPEGRTSQPPTLVVRNRKKSNKLEALFNELDKYDQLDGEDDVFLQRSKTLKKDRAKTLQERRKERQASSLKDSSFKARKTLAERYSELKDRDEVTAKNLATLMRDSTLKKMEEFSKESQTWKNVKRSYHDFGRRISLWYSTFMKIEGQNGTAVMTYFRFLKWLLKLNMYMMVITFCVITIPYLVLGPSTYEESVQSFNFTGQSINCTSDYVKYMDNFTSLESVGEKVIDLLQGTGWMERTILFYGVYYNKTYYNEIEEKETTYNMSLAYLLAVGVSFLISFILIVKNCAKNFKVTLGMESLVAKNSNKVFAGWDYCIKNQKAAKVKSAGIKFEIAADIKEEKRRNEWEDKGFSDRCTIYFKRVVINILIVILLGGSLALIGYTAKTMIDLQKNEYEEIIILIIQYVPYITITILNLVMPIIFQKLVQFEMYRYEKEIIFTIARSVLLRLSSPVVLLAIMYEQLIYTSGKTGVGQCGNNKWSTSNTGIRGDVKCWESYVGQQIYKLVLIDLFVECGIIFFANIPRSLLYTKFKDKFKIFKMIGPQEFDLTMSVVDIVYSQNICWLGMMFSPLIPFMTFLKILIFFYAKILLLKFCEAQERPYRTSRSNSLFMTVLLLAFIFAAAPIGYMVGNIQPSQSCGPFRLYPDSTNVMFDTVSYTVASWPTTLRDLFTFLGTVGFLVPVIIFLCLLMYYYWLRSQGYKKTEEYLQYQVKLEGQDKRYLMDKVMEFLQSAEVNQNTVYNAGL